MHIFFTTLLFLLTLSATLYPQDLPTAIQYLFPLPGARYLSPHIQPVHAPHIVRDSITGSGVGVPPKV